MRVYLHFPCFELHLVLVWCMFTEDRGQEQESSDVYNGGTEKRHLLLK
jgi:hypothetical protein